MSPSRRLYKTSDHKFARQLKVATAMFCRFLSAQYNLGDSFLKSSKDFVYPAPACSG